MGGGSYSSVGPKFPLARNEDRRRPRSGRFPLFPPRYREAISAQLLPPTFPVPLLTLITRRSPTEDGHATRAGHSLHPTLLPLDARSEALPTAGLVPRRTLPRRAPTRRALSEKGGGLGGWVSV